MLACWVRCYIAIFGDGIRLTYRVVTDKEHKIAQDLEADPADEEVAERNRKAKQAQAQGVVPEALQQDDIDTQLDPKLHSIIM